MTSSNRYKDFSQADLDHQYSPSQWVPNSAPAAAIQRHIDRLTTFPPHLHSEAHYSRYSYHDYPSCNIHLVQPKTKKTDQMLVYLHGGYWTAGVLENAGLWLWRGMKHTGASLAAVEYGLSPPCRMEEIILHVQTAIAFLSRAFPRCALHVVGHSAGGHLAAMCLSANWSEFGVPESGIVSVTCISGVFDLEPIRLSCVDSESQLGLQAEDCENFSPMRLVEKMRLPRDITIVVGKFDSPEFQRQSREFFDAIQRRNCEIGSSCRTTFLSLEEDHFSVVEKLDNPEYQLTKLVAQLLQQEEE